MWVSCSESPRLAAHHQEDLREYDEDHGQPTEVELRVLSVPHVVKFLKVRGKKVDLQWSEEELRGHAANLLQAPITAKEKKKMQPVLAHHWNLKLCKKYVHDRGW